MNGNLIQFDEYQQIQGQYEQQQQQQQAAAIDPNNVGDIRDYLTSDFKLSDTALNDLFSEFDFKPDDFQCFDSLPNSNTYSQTDLPPSYDTALLANVKPQQSPAMNEYMSSNALQSLIEQHHQNQPTIIKYSSSPPPQSIPTNYLDVILPFILIPIRQMFSFFFRHRRFHLQICPITNHVENLQQINAHAQLSRLLISQN